MRKLFDCPTKISDATKQMKIPTARYEVPIEKITLLKPTINPSDFLNQQAFREQRHLRYICGVLIHSLAFELVYHGREIVGFFVTSDTCNANHHVKNVFFIDIHDWLSCMQAVAQDQVMSIHYSLDQEASAPKYKVATKEHP